MQESRLFRILYYLLDKGRATAPDLAKRFEVSTRTIYRDIDALSSAGIPVYAEAGRGGGICLMNHFVLDRAVLTEAEKQDILSALQNVAAAGNKGGEETLEKLSALFRIQAENWYEVDFARWGVSTGDHEKFELLKNAVLTHRCVKILYAASGHEKTCRTVEPLKLLYKSKSWYLKAYCLEKEALRLFKLNRILEWEALDEYFVPGTLPEPGAAPQSESQRSELSQPGPQQLELLQPGPSQKEAPQVILSFPGEMAYRVYDEFDSSQIRELENGSLLTTAQMPVDEWLIAFLLSFGDRVEIIEPLCLKAVLAERALKIYEKNKPAGEYA